MLMSFTADRKALQHTMDHYRQEVLDESTGACTNSLAVNIYAPNGAGLLVQHYFTTYFYVLWLDR